MNYSLIEDAWKNSDYITEQFRLYDNPYEKNVKALEAFDTLDIDYNLQQPILNQQELYNNLQQPQNNQQQISALGQQIYQSIQNKPYLQTIMNQLAPLNSTLQNYTSKFTPDQQLQFGQSYLNFVNNNLYMLYIDTN